MKIAELYSVFGEFDSAEEINLTAAGLREEGDKENLLILAMENGIDKDIVEVFLDGDIDFIADNTSAAIGKLDVELAELNNDALASEIADILKSHLLSDEALQVAIRRKDKCLKKFVEQLWKEAQKRATSVHGGSGCSIMPAEEFRMAKTYYLT